MIDIISEKTIKTLLKNSTPITSKQIAQEIGMSVSSVKHNMDFVRQIIRPTGAVLNSVPGKGFWLDVDQKAKEQLELIVNEHQDKSYSFAFRKNYILNILFQNNSNYTIQLFADDLGIGRNIIIKDLELIEKWLTYFDLKIIKIRNRGVSIEGGEFNKRQAIIYNNASTMDVIDVKDDKPESADYRISQLFYSYFTQVYGENNFTLIQSILKGVEEKINFTFDDISFTQLMEYLAVCFYRIKGNNVIIEKNVLNSCKVTASYYEVAKTIILKIANNIPAYLSIEIRCLAAQFILYGSYESSESVIKEDYYTDYARTFIVRLKNIIVNKNLLINESLISDIGLFFQKKKMQQSYQMINSSYFRQDIKQQLPSLYGIILANIQPVETKLKVKFTENDIAYFVMLIDNAIEDPIQELNILLVTSFDYNTSKYLKNKIKRFIPNINKLKIIHADDVKYVDIDKYDLILTTIPTELKNTLKISRRIDNNDFNLINNAIEKIQKKKQEIVTTNYQLFNEHLVIPNLNAKRKEEVIEAGCKLLLDNNYVTNGFENTLLQRENITPTSIGNGVAIPHGYKTCVKKSGVAIVKLKHPLAWTEEDKVEIVFIIAIDFETQAEISNFFSQFYELIDNKEIINAIKKATSINSILDSIEKSGIVVRNI